MDDESENEVREAWLVHPWTRKLARDAEPQVNSSLQRLEDACVNTNDSKVAAAYWLWRAARMRKEELT